MSEKIDKLRASLEKEKERRIKINNRIESLERRIQEAEAAEVNEMVRTAKVTPEQLAALLRQSATSTPNPAALSAVGATIDKEDPDNEDDEYPIIFIKSMKNSHHDKVRPLMLTTRIILHSDNLLTSVICITSTILHIKIAPQIIDATTQTIKKVIYNVPPIFCSQ